MQPEIASRVSGEKINREFRFQLDMRKQNMYYSIHVDHKSRDFHRAAKIDGEDAAVASKISS